MHDYSMFSDGDRVIVAVSGGVDSLTLACILQLWQQKAPIHFDLIFIHIDHGFWKDEAGVESPISSIGNQLDRFDITLQVYDEWESEESKRSCFTCSRNRRSQLFDLAKKLDCTKIAFGHHKDDLIETFFINTMFSGNISTMRPKQNIFENRLSLVRPMAYLEKNQVIEISKIYGLTPVKNFCPYSHNSKREKVRDMLQTFYMEEPGTRESVFAALSNVRAEYLL